MPIIKNKKTGVEYPVTNEELKNIKADEDLARGFEIKEAETPKEVTDLRDKKETKNKTVE